MSETTSETQAPPQAPESPKTAPEKKPRSRGLIGGAPEVRAVLARLLEEKEPRDRSEVEAALRAEFKVEEAEAKSLANRLLTVCAREGLIEREGAVIRRGPEFLYLSSIGAATKAQMDLLRAMKGEEAYDYLWARRSFSAAMSQPDKARAIKAGKPPQAPQERPAKAAKGESPAAPAEPQESAVERLKRESAAKGEKPDAKALKAAVEKDRRAEKKAAKK